MSLSVIVVLVAAALSQEGLEWRTWTSANGKHHVEAAFVKMSAGRVTLQKRDKTQIHLQLKQLSKDDQTWIKEKPARDRMRRYIRSVVGAEREPADAPEKEKPKPPHLDPMNGDVFTVKVDTLLAAKNVLFVREMVHAIQAEDVEGMQLMMREGRLTVLDEEDLLRVLKVESNAILSPFPFVECRLLRGKEAIGTVYVLSVFFSADKMERHEG